MEFRNLRADEIMVRPTDTKTKGSATLLLYQDQRCAMDILDETVGPENWQKDYYEVKGNVYCRIGIKCGDEWVWKADCGVESNVDAQKGEASDAAKRAAVCWGIGRELYTAPRIRIKCEDTWYYNEKLTMQFFCREIGYNGKKINHLIIVDRNGNPVFVWDAGKPVPQPSPEPKKTNRQLLKEYCVSIARTEPKEKIRGFYDYYNGDRADNWSGVFNPERLYARWGARN